MKILTVSLLLALLLALLSGCSSIAARVGDDSQMGNPYAGLSYYFFCT
jgi:uncharacterized protein YceK